MAHPFLFRGVLFAMQEVMDPFIYELLPRCSNEGVTTHLAIVEVPPWVQGVPHCFRLTLSEC